MIALAAYVALAAPIASAPAESPVRGIVSARLPVRGVPVTDAMRDAPVGAQPATPIGAVPAAAAPTVKIDAPAEPAPGDPHERFNRGMFARYQKFDRAVFRPAAMGYKHAVPHPLRSGLRHFFSNLTEPVVFLNFLLQGKVGKAAETLGRFVTNSTLGIGGLIDVAKTPTINLPHRPNGFADTLGFYGVKPGAYLFLPIIGPTTVRDLIGGQVVDGAIDSVLFPLTIGKPFNKLYFQIPRAVLEGLDRRAEADDDLKTLLADAVDPYATLRSVYLQDRAAEIAALHSHRRPTGAMVPANDNLADPLVDPAAKAPPPPASDSGALDDPLIDPAAPVTSPPVAPPDAAAPAAPARR